MSQTAAIRLNHELTEPWKRSPANLPDFTSTAQCLCGSHDKEALRDLKEEICIGGEVVQSVMRMIKL